MHAVLKLVAAEVKGLLMSEWRLCILHKAQASTAALSGGMLPRHAGGDGAAAPDNATATPASPAPASSVPLYELKQEFDFLHQV